MTPQQLKAFRRAFDLSVEQFASVVAVEGRTVRRWEDSTREIPGTIDVLCDLLVRSPQARRLLGV